MCRVQKASVLWVVLGLCLSAFCRDTGKSGGTKNKTRTQHLTLVDDVTSKSELAQAFIDPIQCDSDGNLYLMTVADATSGIRKVNPKGQRTATFVANSGIDLR